METVRWMKLVLAGMCCVGIHARAADEPKIPLGNLGGAVKSEIEKPAVPAKINLPLLSKSIATLTKEYQAGRKDPKTNSLRKDADYFKKNPSPDVTPDFVMKGLEQSVTGGKDAEAYVKWQLLSGIADKFPESLMSRAVNVYKRAPNFGHHPGLERAALKNAIRNIKKEGMAQINKEMDSSLDELSNFNRPVLAYRNALYEKMPKKSGELMIAALHDIYDRAASGLNANSFYDTVSVTIRSWALLEGKSSQIRGLIAQLDSLHTLAADEEAKPYSKLIDDKGIKWKSEPILDAKKVRELAKFLDDNAGGAASGGLKFKDK